MCMYSGWYWDNASQPPSYLARQRLHACYWSRPEGRRPSGGQHRHPARLRDPKQLRGLNVAMVRPYFSPSVLRMCEQAVLQLNRMSVKSASVQFCMCSSSLQQGFFTYRGSVSTQMMVASPAAWEPSTRGLPHGDWTLSIGRVDF